MERAVLEKKFKPHWVWAMAFGAAIGWGSFVLPVPWMAQGGPFGMIIGFAIGAVIMSFIGISTGYLIRAFPVTGGAFTYAYLCYGRNHAYLCGWFLILGYSAIIALNASAFGLMIKFLAPGITDNGLLYTIAGWDVYAAEVAIISAVIILFAVLNIFGASASLRTQFWFCVFLLGGAAAVVIGMATSPTTSFANLMPPFQPTSGTLGSILLFVAISPWAFVGFDSIPQAAEEFNFSHKKAMRLILIALFVAFLHYAYMMIATGIAMPWEKLVLRNDVWGTGYAIQHTLGAWGLAVLVLALVMGILTGIIGFYIATSRLMFAMARAKALPPVFGRLHSRYHTPYASIIFVCIICLAAPWFGRPVLLWIVDMSALGMSIAFFYYGMVCFRLFKWSDRSKDDGFSTEVAPFKKVIGGLAAFFSLGILLLLLIPGSPSVLQLPSWIALAVWVVLGILIYLVIGKRYRETSKEELDILVLGHPR